MSLSPEIRRLVQKALRIRGSEVPLHRVLDILATEDGDVSEAVNRFRDIKNDSLRIAFHNCALLLRALEADAGLTPAWESKKEASCTPTSQASDQPAADSATEPKRKLPTSRFSPDELKPFVNETLRGKVEVAKVYVDGASRGNPGPAGIGVALFTMEGKKIAQISRAIGTATNNFAEYTALIEALKLANNLGIRQLHVLSDSQLMVHQMTGRYRIKHPEIAKLATTARKIAKQFEKVTFSYIARENNRLADALSTAPIASTRSSETMQGYDNGHALEWLFDDNPDEGRTE